MAEVSDRELSEIAVRATVHALGFDPLTHWIERPTGGNGIRVVNTAGPQRGVSNRQLAALMKQPAFLARFSAYAEKDAAGKVKRPVPAMVKVQPEQDPGLVDRLVALMAVGVLRGLARER